MMLRNLYLFPLMLLGAALGLWPTLASAQSAPATPPAAATPPVKKTYDPHVGASTGLPIPRFVSLRADQVNMRVGPGDQYPIAWLYQRAGLPVEVLREYDVWRLVEDADGTKGWMNGATLVSTRRFIVTGANAVTVFDSPAGGASQVAQLMPGVIGTIERCDTGADWCHVRVAHIRGWLKRADFWGSLPGEQIR
jgi:SH3-like domain-containing protein